MDQAIIRPAKTEDVLGILEVHYSAINETAAKDYTEDIRSEWAPPVTRDRIESYLRDVYPKDTTLVAEVNANIAGFGAVIVSDEQLRALYVSHRFGQLGIGSALLRGLEKLAKEKGCTQLHLLSSLTAEIFYLRHGYERLRSDEHTLSSGRRMACIRMRKTL